MANLDKKRGLAPRFSIISKIISSQSGVSIVEVMIALGLAAMLGWVLADQQATQLKNNAFNQSVITAQDLKVRLGGMLRDEMAWANTTLQNSAGHAFPAGGMDCLVNNTSCVARAASPLAFELFPQSGTTPLFYSFTTGAANQQGFTSSGTPCNQFNDTPPATAGDPYPGHATCVFSYQITWEVDAACGTGPCKNPPVKIKARLVHRPLPGIIPLNTEKYSYLGTDAFVRSGGKATQLSWKLEHSVAGATGGGTCSTVAPGAPRVLTVTSDPDSVITAGNNTTSISVSATGTFSCSYSAQCFAGGNFTTSLFVEGAAVSSVSGTALPWSSAAVNGTAVFTFNGTPPFQLQLYQVCQSLPGGTPSADGFTLGLPGPTYVTPGVFASINCSSVL